MQIPKCIEDRKRTQLDEGGLETHTLRNGLRRKVYSPASLSTTAKHTSRVNGMRGVNGWPSSIRCFLPCPHIRPLFTLSINHPSNLGRRWYIQTYIPLSPPFRKLREVPKASPALKEAGKWDSAACYYIENHRADVSGTISAGLV